MIADTANIATIVPPPALFQVQREPVIQTTHFVQKPVIIDRDYDIAAQVKFTGLIIASAITLITAAIFLFM